MYSRRSGLIIGFHGGDKDICEKIIRREIKNLRKSNNSWDWLGKGIYFWENNPKRALEFAKEQALRSSSVKTPFVLGAVIDLGYCLDLMDSSNLKLLTKSHETLCEVMAFLEKPMPQNRPPKNDGNKSDNLIRELDCAVIEHLHSINENKPFDSVRGIFTEGNPLYENAGFRDKDHIQICIRNPNCIKGYFLPRVKVKNYERV